MLGRTIAYANGHRRLMTWLCLAGCLAWLAIGIMLGPHYDYTPYMKQWVRILAGENPWQGDSDNAYGPGQAALALLFYIHPLAPKFLFLLCWIGVFLIVFKAGQRDTALGLLSFLVLFAMPFFFILVCVYGVGDALVTFLTLLAVDLKTRKAQCILPAILLGLAVLTKLYPLALVPFLATDRGEISFRFILAVALSVALGALATFAVWGWSVAQIVEFAMTRDGKMLSLFWFLSQSRISPLAGTPLADTLIAWNAVLVAIVMAAFYLAQLMGKTTALAGTTIAMIALLAFYKVGNPQYFICSAALLIYFLAAMAGREGRIDKGLLLAAVGYLLVLNAFEVWYILGKDSLEYLPVKNFIGLPCFVTSVALLWQLILFQRLSRPAQG